MARVRELRLYFNNHGNPDEAWCVDMNGVIAYASEIRLNGVTGEMVYRPKDGDNVETPVAWLLIDNAEVNYEGTTAFVRQSGG